MSVDRERLLEASLMDLQETVDRQAQEFRLKEEQAIDRVELAEKSLVIANETRERFEDSLRDYEVVVEEVKHELSRFKSQAAQKDGKLRQEVDSLKAQNMSLYEMIEVLNTERANLSKKEKSKYSCAHITTSKTRRSPLENQINQSELKFQHDDAINQIANLRIEMQLKDECIADLALKCKRQHNEHQKIINELKVAHAEEVFNIKEENRLLNFRLSVAQSKLLTHHTTPVQEVQKSSSNESAIVDSRCSSTNNSIGVSVDWIDQCVQQRKHEIDMGVYPLQSVSRKVEESNCNSPVALPRPTSSEPFTLEDIYPMQKTSYFYSPSEANCRIQPYFSSPKANISPKKSEQSISIFKDTIPAKENRSEVATQTCDCLNNRKNIGKMAYTKHFGISVSTNALLLALLVYLITRYGLMTQNIRKWIISLLQPG